MKKNLFKWMMAIAIVATPMAFVSCGDDDDDNGPEDGKEVTPELVTIGFENQTLNGQGFWCGTASGESLEPIEDDLGGTTTTYLNTYKEEGATFNTTYNKYSSPYGDSDYWFGYAISQRKETTFSPNTRTPDQYNNIVGKAFGGDKFCVVQTYGESIVFDRAVTLADMAYTNSAYVVNSILNGDNYAKKFDENDYLNCTVEGYSSDSTLVGTVKIDLASNGKYVDTWKQADLSKLKGVKYVKFTFTGSDTGDYGLNTPAYICIDNLRYEK